MTRTMFKANNRFAPRVVRQYILGQVSQHDWALKFACIMIQFYKDEDARMAAIKNLRHAIHDYVDKKAH